MLDVPGGKAKVGGDVLDNSHTVAERARPMEQRIEQEVRAVCNCQHRQRQKHVEPAQRKAKYRDDGGNEVHLRLREGERTYRLERRRERMLRQHKTLPPEREADIAR